MSDLKKWYLGGMVVAADKAEFKEDEHPRGKGGMFVKKGEGGGSDGVAGKVAAYREKHEAFSKELLKDLNSPVAEKMRGELQSMLSELDGMGVDVERLGVGKEDKIPMKADKAEFKKSEGGGGLSALEEVYKKGGFKHPEALAKADLEELGKMNDSRLDAEITMLKGKVEEGGKPLDKARLEAAEGIMKGRSGKKVGISAKGILTEVFKTGWDGKTGDINKSAEITLANWDTHSIADAEKLLGFYGDMENVPKEFRDGMQSAIKTYIQERKDLEKMDDVGLGKAMADAINGKDKVRQHMIGEEQNRRYADKVSKMDDKELEDAVKSNESLVKKYGSGDDNPYVKSLEIAKVEKAKRGENVAIGSKLSKEQEREVNHLLKMDNEEFDDVYDYTKSWIEEARSGSFKLANGEKMSVPNWMLKRQEDFLGLLEVAKAKRGVKK